MVEPAGVDRNTLALIIINALKDMGWDLESYSAWVDENPDTSIFEMVGSQRKEFEARLIYYYKRRPTCS